MSPTERRQCLDTIGWSQRWFAAIIQRDESTVRRWFRDYGEAPPEIDEWLKTVADFHENHPPPKD